MARLPIQLVDEDDNPIGGGEYEEIHAKGLRQRVSRVMIEDEQSNILLQTRVADKELFPDCWDNSAAGHVDDGETHLTAAKREFAEEVGLENVKLTEIAHYKTDTRYRGRKLKRWNHLYRGVIPHDSIIRMQASEVSATKWATREGLQKLIERPEPRRISDGFVEAREIMYKS